MAMHEMQNPPVVAISETGSLWWNRRFRAWIPQALLILLVGAAVWFFAYNASLNIGRQKLSFGLDFLSREAGFGIGENLHRI